jgi:DNA-binding SARP family transcriptional activator
LDRPSRGRQDSVPEAVRVWLLGGFWVSVGSQTIEQNKWRLRKAASLVKLLAIAPGHRIHREHVMYLLWPDLGRKAASNNLRRVLHAARKVLDSATGSLYLASQDESLMLCPGGQLWVDAEAFAESAVSARGSQDPSAYRAAIELYAGELLPDDRYEEWAENRRGQLRRLYFELLVELTGLYEERREYGQAAEPLQRALSEEPTNEELRVARNGPSGPVALWRSARSRRCLEQAPQRAHQPDHL